jgi:ABC-type branched-subunit amino acid transport system substrate-binding protein
MTAIHRFHYYISRLAWIPLLTLLSATGHAENGITPKQIVIGQNITLQGGKNDYAQAIQDGIGAYLSTVNASGGVNGRQIVVTTLDDDNQPAKAEANARTLVEKNKVFILFGSIEGGPSTAVMKAAVDLNVPFFGPMAGSPTLRRPHQPMVFPVRAEHRDEFRALINYTKQTGGSRVAFFRADSETGLQHLENVKLLCKELGMELVADLPFKSDISDAQLDAVATQIGTANPHVVINHGGIGVYERLIRKARAQGLRTNFSAVNSGSAQLAKHLGALAPGMVFAQVVPSPWERKTAMTREYQATFSQYKPGTDFSYGSMEGFITAKALVAALKLAGPNPTRASFVQGLDTAGELDLNGLRALYKPGMHTGLSFVELSIVTKDGKFRH